MPNISGVLWLKEMWKKCVDLCNMLCLYKNRNIFY